MVQRLVDRYPIGHRVEIKLSNDHWQSGLVMGHDHPGLWVLLDDGAQWFVTNGSHIRPAPDGSTSHEAVNPPTT